MKKNLCSLDSMGYFKWFLPCIFLILFVFGYIIFVPKVFATECICSTTGSQDASDCADCVSVCNGAGGVMQGFGGVSGSSCAADGVVIEGGGGFGGNVCVCTGGRDAGISDPTLEQCCSACGPTERVESVQYNSVTETCPSPTVGGAPSTSSRSRTPSSYGYRNPLGTTNVNRVIGRIIRAAVGVIGALFLAMFVWGGTLWMTAGGDAERVKKAQRALFNALIGIAVVALSYTILNILFGIAGNLTGG